MARGLSASLLSQRGQLFGWVPVGLGTGIGLYFALRVEPGAPAYAALALVTLAGFWAARREGPVLSCLGWAAMLVAGGLCLAGLRAHAVAEPVLGFRYYGAIEGRIVKIDRSASDAVRLTLDRVVLERMSRARTPTRVRVSLHGEQGFIAPVPGMVVILTGHLSPPSGPVEPGGFDFRRMSWFSGLGAVGYTRTPVLMLSGAEPDPALWIYRVRMALSAAMQDRMAGEAGAFAAAVTTGDRSAMPARTLEALRASNLAHLLAISGLHMGLLTGFLFALTRYGLALVPWVALRFNTKKAGAVLALLAGAGYLALSGGNVATERAFIMVGVMLVAVLFDRRALTLRAVAVAAVIVLIRRPEELTGPGFQMSFAATTALVAVFGGLRGVRIGPRWLQPVISVVLSSLIAGLATAPFAAAHFNQVSHYGLVANVLSVPVMGAVVMPAAVLAAVLAPLGLAGIGLWVMELGLRWILAVAKTVSGWEGAISHVVAPGDGVLPLLAIGALWVILWRGRLRWGGLAPLCLAAALWSQAERPALLVADTGGLVGVMTPEGRALSKPKGDGFSAEIWLENDGAPMAQDAAHDLGAIRRGDLADVGPLRVLHVTGKRALAAVEGCGGADILVTNVDETGERPCVMLDLLALRAAGAVAGHVEGAGLRLVTSRGTTGHRLWTPEVAEVTLPRVLAPGPAARVAGRAQ
ncbi:ComEC/Rec2 family competence protein [Roseisalinus antarcticus]|uniref:ComEC family competence protein n=1 Tax=Roseisalinus antarcticus TaxID=254357 RepID=A0A1Y5RJF4_9RHOB|nr:ComEC/Rec2 family competence protein [Roseisalinus antarcticus]SLN16284.1 ComEC family competence protein [Roseisalinus antarcticus]